MGETAVQSVAEVRVEAGRTTILELRTEGQALMDVSGSLEISVVDENGAPLATGTVYLTSETGDRSYAIELDEQGQGRLDGIVPGRYILSLEPISVPAPGGAGIGISGAATGNYEIDLKDKNGAALAVGPVYLISENWENAYEIKIDSAGHGERSGIVPGRYHVCLEKKIILEHKIYFALGKNYIDHAAGRTLDDIVKYLSERATENVEMLICLGCASDDGSKSLNYSLSIERAATVRDALKDKFKLSEKLKDMHVKTDARGEIALSREAQEGGSEQLKKKEREQNRRVEFQVLFK